MSPNRVSAPDRAAKVQRLQEAVDAYTGMFCSLGDLSTGLPAQVTLLADRKPYVLVVDLPEVEGEGLILLESMAHRFSEFLLLVRTAKMTNAMLLAAVRMGVVGFLDENSSADEIAFAVCILRQGQSYLSPSMSKRFVQALQIE